MWNIAFTKSRSLLAALWLTFTWPIRTTYSIAKRFVSAIWSYFYSWFEWACNICEHYFGFLLDPIIPARRVFAKQWRVFRLERTSRDLAQSYREARLEGGIDLNEEMGKMLMMRDETLATLQKYLLQNVQLI